MALFDWLGIKGPNDEQKAALEQELETNMSKPQEPLSFKLPDIGSIPKAAANVGSGVGDVISSLAKQDQENRYGEVFQKRSPEEIKNMEDELAKIEEQSKLYQNLFTGVTNPLEVDLDTARKSYITSPRQEKPKAEEPTSESEKIKVSAKTTSKGPAEISAPNTEPKEELTKEPSLFDLLSQPKKADTAYSDALKKSEEGQRLASLLKYASGVGKSISGRGRIGTEGESFADVASLYGDDKRRMDEEAKRKAVIAELEATDANSNVSKGAQAEMAQLLKDTGQEIKDPQALANMSAKDLQPLITAYKARREDQRIRTEKELDRQMQERKFQEEIRARKEIAQLKREELSLAREQKKQVKAAEVANKKDKELNDFVDKAHKENTKQYAAVQSYNTIVPMLQSALTSPKGANSAQQIEAIYNYISNLDQSTVREGEVKLFGDKGASYMDQFKTFMTKFGNDPQVMSNNQFRKLAAQIMSRGNMINDVYDSRMRAVENSFRQRAGAEMLANNPAVVEKLDAVDPDYWKNKRVGGTGAEQPSALYEADIASGAAAELARRKKNK